MRTGEECHAEPFAGIANQHNLTLRVGLYSPVNLQVKRGINYNGNLIISGCFGLPLPACSDTGLAGVTVNWTFYEFIKFDIAQIIIKI
jgi:hypothetical protein